MEEALDEIEFLALSANRIATLEALADRPHTRSDLADATGASQPTLGRVLRDFEERRWVTRTDEGYVTTATGELVAAGVADLVGILEIDRKLRPVVDWLPTAEMEFDLRRLRSATITVPSRTRPSAPLQRLLSLLGDASEVRICSHAFNERSLAAIGDGVTSDALAFEGVLSREAIDVLAADSALRADLLTLIEAPAATVRVHDDEIPVAVTVTDDRAHVMLRDETGLLQAALDTDDPAVLSWAHATYERYWADADPLRADSL